ncbi:MAG: leucine-rich repeat domain-containing protein [Bernardetiaceae bacterium]|nr:leucine-rich repeat domain-containing protein [Bernardetiaceae bacterium]
MSVKNVIKSILLLLIICNSSFYQAQAQSSYQEAIQQGDDAFKKGEFKKAMQKYFAAEAFEPSKRSIVQSKITRVFDKVDGLREQALQAEKRARDSEADAIKNLERALKVSYGTYFYENRFAPAYNSINFPTNGYLGKCYFMDKYGDFVPKLKLWEAIIKSFGNVNGNDFFIADYAIVKKENELVYLLDTLGNTFFYYNNEPNSENKQLAEVLILKGNENIEAFNNQIDANKALKALFLTPNGFENININLSERIETLTDLTDFISLNINLGALPESFTKLKNLRKIDIYASDLSHLPTGFDALENIMVLSLTENKFQTFPEDLYRLNKLEALDISYNQIEHINWSNLDLPNLHELNLSFNRLNTIAPEIGKLTTLRSLDLSNNRFEKLPQSIQKLTKLKAFYNNFHNFEQIPQSLFALSNLETLGLSRGKIQAIPNEISKLKNLKNLNLSMNTIEKISPNIQTLKSLIALNLAFNKIEKLPNEIGKLESLRILELDGNKLTTIPKGLSQLKNLKVLSLTDNPIPYEEQEKIRKMLPNTEIKF